MGTFQFKGQWLHRDERGSLFRFDATQQVWVPISQGSSSNPAAVHKRPTNGVAVAAFVGFIPITTGLLAIILGSVALHQIKRSQGWEKGRGMAITGLILGTLWVLAAIAVLVTLSQI